MTTLTAPETVPPVSHNFSCTETKEELHDIALQDLDDVAMGRTEKNPDCPKGGKCECPRAKQALGLEDHACNPEPSVRCVIFFILCSEGVLLV